MLRTVLIALRTFSNFIVLVVFKIVLVVLRTVLTCVENCFDVCLELF